jgi:hypothetical protein
VTINLFDIPAATTASIDNSVDVRVARVTSGLERNEDGTFTVRVTNAAAPNGVRLTDVTLHLTSSDDEIVQLIPPGSALLFPRATGDTDDPRLSRDEPVKSMFVFFVAGDGDIEPNSTLDVGEEMELEFEYHAVAAGGATISAHIHATVNPADVFPRSGGDDGSHGVTVRG